ncbi:MAG TPA: MG2 domain-containing protein [Pyrinomonadaceae bacterium]|jgi:hypothetical protein
MTRRNLLTALACYLGIVLVLVGFTALRARTLNRFAAESAPDILPEHIEYAAPSDPNAKPFFSVMTNRTYSTRDRARVWINYRAVENLDFRVYRVKDPLAFFKQLDNPHQVGEDEYAEVGEKLKRKPTFLENLRAIKSWIFDSFKAYVRSQLQQQSRKNFNQKFRTPEEDDTSHRMPLNVADYARVPLLNPDQMVSSWREKLPPLDSSYDRRMISLGRREPGVYLVEVVNGDLRAFGIAIVTDLAMVQKTSRDGQVLVYAVDRQTGAPREGTRVEVFRGKQAVTSGTTNGEGLLRTRIQQPTATDDGEEGTAADETASEEATDEPVSDSYLFMAKSGENFAISDLDSYYFGASEGEEGGNSNLKSYLYTDRPVYRPEHKVYFKGIVRELTEQGYRLVGGTTTANVIIEDPSGARISEQELPLSSRGSFSGELDVPEGAPLGSYSITAQIGDATVNGSFEVQEYKKPEYKVKVTVPEKYMRVGDKMKFNVSARYFFGAPVTKADVKYYIYRTHYEPWWRDTGEDEESAIFVENSDEEESGSEDYYGYDDQIVQEGEGKLDAQGRLEVEFKVPEPDAKEKWDYSYRLEAQVTDAARRMMDASASFVGVRGKLVASADPERYVYNQGDTARIRVRSNDHEGRPQATRVKLTFVERRWKKVIKKTDYGDDYPTYEPDDRVLSSASVDTNQQGEAIYDYQVTTNGSIHIKTSVEEDGREIVYEGGYVWVADRENDWSDYSYQGEETVKLVPDKKSYRVGETAHVLALLPKADAHLLVTTELRNVMNVRTIAVKGRSVVIDVPIEARFAPNVFLNVTYVKDSEMYTQDQSIVVPPRDRLINLEILSNKKEYRPRETVSYTLLARNTEGAPVAGAEVSLGVVDEAIYSIAPENAGDIRREFYGRRYNEVQTNFSVNYQFTGYAGKKIINLAAKRPANQLADFKNDGDLVNPKIRKIFKDTAFWQPSVVTGADGRATVKVELPDNLTTWRATARAITADTRVGTTTQKVLARKDVILRLAMPRFVTQGDTITLSGIVHNYLTSAKTTQISIDIAGARLLDPQMQTVSIAANGEHRVNWRISAPTTGELKILAKALTDTESDAIETSLEVVPRGLKQTRGESSVLLDDTERTLTYNLPVEAEPNARALRVELSPSIASTLFGALDYLTTYPYGCTEQTMSSFLPNVIVAQALQNVETASLRDSNNIERKVRRGLRRLYSFQHTDGGWGWWKDDPTDAWMSAYVIDGLVMARRAGYEVDETRLENGRKKLKTLIEARKTDDGKEIDAETRAYMVYALYQSGEPDARYINELFNTRGNLQAYGRALLALALHERGDRQRASALASEIERAATSDERGAHWSSRYNSHGMAQANDVEATALSVKALARLLPQSELLPRAARWLVLSRRFGHYWHSTKETAFAIYGLTDYLKMSQELSPDYELKVYLNGEEIFTRHVTASDAASAQSFVINRRGAEVGARNELRIVKQGQGVLYLSTTFTHYSNEEDVAARSTPELKLTREYLRLRIAEGMGGALAWKVEPLEGDIRSGDIIVSRLRLEGAPARYLLIEDPIPAGCEQVQNVSGFDFDYSQQDWSSWYSSREFRDQKTAIFLNYFGGKATYQTAMRVQVPGQLRIAPARVEMMYMPTVQANSASSTMNILDSK